MALLKQLSERLSFPKLNSSEKKHSKNCVTIIYAGWIATCAEETNSSCRIDNSKFEVIKDGALAISNNRIMAISTKDQIMNQVKTNEKIVEIFLSQHHMLIPGLINCHTHLAMSLLRGFADDYNLNDWLTKFIWPAEEKMISDEFVYTGTLYACYEAIKSGTTLVNDSYFLPDSILRALDSSGIRSVCAQVILDHGKNDMEQEFENAKKFVQSSRAKTGPFGKENSLSQASLNPHSCYMVDPQLLKKLGDLQKEFNQDDTQNPVLCHIHMHETRKEINEFVDKYAKSPFLSLDEAGLVNEHLIAAHCVHMSPEDVQLCVDKKVNICHCLKSNMKLGSGISQVADHLKKGINVCLGTDGACSNNSVDMLSEMQSVGLVHKGVNEDPTVLDAYTVLTMATRNGSKAVGRSHDLGTLEVGKLADIVAVDLAGADLMGLPIFDPVCHLVYTTHPQVTDVWVDGKQLMKNKEILTIKLNNSVSEPLVVKLKNLQQELVKKFNEDHKK